MQGFILKDMKGFSSAEKIRRFFHKKKKKKVYGSISKYKGAQQRPNCTPYRTQSRNLTSTESCQASCIFFRAGDHSETSFLSRNRRQQQRQKKGKKEKVRNVHFQRIHVSSSQLHLYQSTVSYKKKRGGGGRKVTMEARTQQTGEPSRFAFQLP